MDKSKAFFNVRKNERLGDRLILRYPATNPTIMKALESRSVNSIPASITIGYYLQLDEPDGAWCFMPVTTPAAKALLTTAMVQERIVYDLLNRM